MQVITWEEEHGWRKFNHPGCAGWHTRLTDPIPDAMDCVGTCRKRGLRVFPLLGMAREYPPRIPSTRKLAEAWHEMALESHPEWKAWGECSKEYREGLEARFARLIAQGLVL